jgi:hypothetical protein
MKKIIPIVVIGVLLISGLGAVALPEIEPEMSVKREILSFSDLQIIEENDNSIVQIGNANSWLRAIGFPLLPIHIETYILPFGTSIKGVDVTFSEPQEYILEKKIIFTPKPVCLVSGKTISANQKITYSDANVYPEKRFSYDVHSGINDNERVIFLTIRCYPVQYIASENKILYCNNAEISITYDANDHQVVFDDLYDMVIIAPNSFSTAIQSLIDHKNDVGVDTFLKTTEDIYNEYAGIDEAEQIKYFIKDAIETNDIDYVLLVGGRNGQRFDWHVPVRYSHLDDESNFETSFVSDLYYADIYEGEGNFSSWDSNGNGIFAEWNDLEKDIIDLIPDVYLGRLPCRNKFEVRIMVNKIITYENFAYGTDWFNRMVVVGGDSAPGDEYYEGEEENKKALEYLDDFEGIKLWTSDESFTGVDDVVNGISDGCGFLFFDGHGNPSTWSTHPPNDAETWITGLNNQDMSKLKNKDQIPVAVIGGCHNGQFNVTLSNIIKGIMEEGFDYFKLTFYYKEWVPECWAWRMTRKIGGGSIAIMAYTGLDWFATGDYDGDDIPDCTQYYSGFANTNFFKNYGVNNITILGQAHTQTLIDYINAFPPMDERLDCKTVQEFALLGDPSLQIGGYP